MSDPLNIYQQLKFRSDKLFILFIVIAGFAMRIKGLTFQSLWLDELHTMNEADPHSNWSTLFFYLKCCDQHPPLYFIIERIFFSIFGYTEFVARFISVIAGTLSIWAMYLLGKELLNKNLGLIAATLTCINFYNLSYSQEARPYIFAFLFVILSFLFFIKLFKAPSAKNAIYYSLFTLGLLYSHYYSLFILASQFVLGGIFIFQEKGNDRKRLFRLFSLSAIIIAIVYAPWFSFFTNIAGIKSFWINQVDHSFLQNYFREYFGNSNLLNLLFIPLLLVYFIKTVSQGSLKDLTSLKNNSLRLSFCIFLIWIFVTVLIPYVRSLTTVPMLFPRYTIVILPAILLSLAFGIELLENILLKWLITLLIAAISLINILLEKNYYRAITKTQFREMTQFVVKANKENYPIINETTAWHQEYYLRKYNSKAEIFSDPKESIVDSILAKTSSKYNINGFWIVGAHGEKMLDSLKRKCLDTSYILIKQKEFYDAWAQLFISKKRGEDKYVALLPNDFVNAIIAQNAVAIWSGSIHSRPFYLAKGNYSVTVNARGTPAAGQFPHFNIYIDGKKIGNYYLTDKPEDKNFIFKNPESGNLTVLIEMDNDFYIPGKEDRNAFIRSVIFQPSY